MYKFYWYPKCSTCKKAKSWLEQAGVSYETLDLIECTPAAAQFVKWQKETGLPMRRFFNTSGIKYRALGLKEKLDGLSNEEAAQLLASDGMLVKRPLVIKNDSFLINGFKEKNYEEVFKK